MEKVEIAKRALIIVDMINGFVKEGQLADPNIGRITLENVKLAKEFILSDDPVIAFRDVHTLESLELNTFPEHCMDGTDEVELIPELKKLENELKVINKNSTSGMFSPGFMEYIESMKELTEIVITGCCTDICIMNLAIPLKNFFNQINRAVEVIVPINAVDTYHIEGIHERAEWNDMAFKFMEQSGITLVKKYEVKYGK